MPQQSSTPTPGTEMMIEHPPSTTLEPFLRSPPGFSDPVTRSELKQEIDCRPRASLGETQCTYPTQTSGALQAQIPLTHPIEIESSPIALHADSASIDSMVMSIAPQTLTTTEPTRCASHTELIGSRVFELSVTHMPIVAEAQSTPDLAIDRLTAARAHSLEIVLYYIGIKYGSHCYTDFDGLIYEKCHDENRPIIWQIVRVHAYEQLPDMFSDEVGGYYMFLPVPTYRGIV